jgi:hypothetical protein
MNYVVCSYKVGERKWTFQLTPREMKLLGSGTSWMDYYTYNVLNNLCCFGPTDGVFRFSGGKDPTYQEAMGILRGVNPESNLCLTVLEFIQCMSVEPVSGKLKDKLDHIRSELGIVG